MTDGSRVGKVLKDPARKGGKALKNSGGRGPYLLKTVTVKPHHDATGGASGEAIQASVSNVDNWCLKHLN